MGRFKLKEIEKFAGKDVAILKEVRKPNMDMHIPGDYRLCIRTLEGVMDARRGDYIIKGVNGGAIRVSLTFLRKLTRR